VRTFPPASPSRSSGSAPPGACPQTVLRTHSGTGFIIETPPYAGGNARRSKRFRKAAVPPRARTAPPRSRALATSRAHPTGPSHIEKRRGNPGVFRSKVSFPLRTGKTRRSAATAPRETPPKRRRPKDARSPLESAHGLSDSDERLAVNACLDGGRVIAALDEKTSRCRVSR